jgi:hypothetical protein
MPSAADELWAEVRAFLPAVDEQSDAACIKFLEDAGYALKHDWTWSKPGITRYKQMTRQELACMMFLVHEWDFGGLAK